MCTGTNNWGVAPVHPGGVIRERGGNSNVGFTVVPPDECLLFELMEWEEGTQLTGNSFNHAHYPENRFADNEDVGEYQILVETDIGLPVVVRYEYGAGNCVVSGTTDGFLHNNPGSYIWGRTGEAMLYYLSSLAGNRWISVEPEDGRIAPGGLHQRGIFFGTRRCHGLRQRQVVHRFTSIMTVGQDLLRTHIVYRR